MNAREIIFKILELETDGFKDEKKLAILAKDGSARRKLLEKATTISDICKEMFSESQR